MSKNKIKSLTKTYIVITVILDIKPFKIDLLFIHTAVKLKTIIIFFKFKQS